MRTLRWWVGGALLVHVIILIWVAWGLPVGPHEAKLYFVDTGLVGRLMRIGHDLFPGYDFINIRFPFLLLHLLNLVLFYRLDSLLLKDEVQIVVALLIFLLLPGIISSAVLATYTGIIMALYQSFLILFLQKKRLWAYLLLPLFLLVDKSCVILYFALFTYGLWHRERWLLVLSSFLFGVALQRYGIDMHGKPVNHFVDTIALYAAIFSPLLFLYFFYAMYRILLKGKKNIIWHLSFTVLILSLVISLRQRIPIADFAPYVVVAIVLMVAIFFRSYNVRLPQFRKKYKLMATMVMGVLFINAIILLFHKPLFLLIDEPKRHFASPFYFPYWCAKVLERRGIKAVMCNDGKLSWQLRYYGIGDKGPWVLSKNYFPNAKKVTIRYKGKPMTSCYVSKLNIRKETPAFELRQRVHYVF